MVKKPKSVFDPKVFLATVDGGRTISDYRKDEVIFLQADRADAVFYIQEGQVKIAVTSEQRKEAVVGIVGPGEFFGEGYLNRPVPATGDGCGADESLDHAVGKSRHGARPPRGAGIRRDVYGSPADA